ncbi:hypothetical protein B0T10DRAFT_157154 [Thelonectria olida]|uniref:Uncharacterized protein n=1 Tax=Thelonectria olida TaxID=1576542 RepID=A0A9P8VVQ4_9HYPO|nr:hypothetical protein B0T10DRAFT_157154 [Thelonectria olida]
MSPTDGAMPAPLYAPFRSCLSDGTPISWFSQVDATYIGAYGILFSGKAKGRLRDSMDEFLELLDGHILRTTKGYFIGISLAYSLLSCRDESSPRVNAIWQNTDQPMSSWEVAIPLKQPIPKLPLLKPQLQSAFYCDTPGTVGIRLLTVVSERSEALGL